MIPDLTIASLLSRYRSGETTPQAVLKEVFDRAAASDPAIWISRPSWGEIESLLGALDPSLPLYGIPFAIKDNIDWDALPTTAACPAYQYQPTQSAFVVDLLIKAGAIPVGKTNLDQFATGLVGVRSPYGVPANAFHADYIPGGSSSGSAVAVALGLASFSLGTDTAGSGRVPAAFNNLIGCKPTRGALSSSGMVPACRTLDSISIFTLTAADAAVVFDLLAKFDAADTYARYPAVELPNPETADVIGVPLPDQLKFFGNESAEALFEQTLVRLSEEGFRIRRINFQPFLDAARLLYEGPWVAERYAATWPLIEQQPEALHPVTRQIISGGIKGSAVEAFKAQYKLAALRRASESVWSEVGTILTPTAGTIYTQAEVAAEPIQTNSNLGYYTNFMNLLDLCACAVPAGFLNSGLPFGVTFMAPAFQDAHVLSLAGQLHAILNLPIGKTGVPSSSVAPPPPPVQPFMKLVVCGAHMEGLPLNPQLTSRGGRLFQKTTSAPIYRLYHLPGGGKLPDRPGMIRDVENGAAIDLEVWELPTATVGSFLNAIPPPLGLGKVQLADGSLVCGFICEGYAAIAENDITHHGGWRSWLAAL